MKVRHCISHYLKDIYELEILDDEHERKKIAIDETLLTYLHNSSMAHWLKRHTFKNFVLYLVFPEIYIILKI